jgi:DNA-binding transcriptional ArsR family regulator
MHAHPASLDLTFAALADPTRRAILGRLMKGEASVNQLVEPFNLSQPTISKHLKVLARAGLVERSQNAQFRPCRLNAERLGEAWRWLGDYRQFWEESFDRLEVFARQLHEKEQREKKHGRKKRKDH